MITLVPHPVEGDSRTYYVSEYTGDDDNGDAMWSAAPMFQWCTETFGPVGGGWKSNRWTYDPVQVWRDVPDADPVARYLRTHPRFGFRSKDDAMMFYLRWHGA